jgi:hypothetical protein
MLELWDVPKLLSPDFFTTRGQKQTYTETISPDKLLRMNRYIDELGEPHLHLAGLKLWVHGYQYRDADDYSDGNWLNATAICSENVQL